MTVSDALPQLFVAGLGNTPLPRTRHSVGQLIVDGLASRYGIHMSSVKGGYMGHGPSVANAYRLSPAYALSKSTHPAPSTKKSQYNTLVVLSDSLDHAPSTLHPRLGGSANGHNGVKSLIQALGGEQGFWRFRVGIGRGTDPATWVLGKLTGHERMFWEQEEGLDTVIDELEGVVRKNA